LLQSIVGASLNGGSAYARLAQFFVDCCREFCSIEPEDVYKKMGELGQKAEEETLITMPLLYGSRRYSRYGNIQNLTYENFTPSQLIKSFLTGIAEELHELYKLMPEAVRLGRVAIAASGNGIRKNPLLVHRIEKLFKVPVRLGEEQEDAAIGAAICAAAGCKIRPNFYI
jgi:sedoheptulokinase